MADPPSETAPAASPADLAKRIATVSLDDAHRLRRRLSSIRRLDGAARRRQLAALAERVARAERRVEVRRAAVPTITIPAQLPVAAHAEELAAAISAHQVIVVAGETGSGKSTQLPKICLQLGRGVRGLIGHTQPRRLAARTLAERIAEETETIVGGAIGYAIRFGDHTGPRTLVKLMTDGILLAEIASDPDLLRYDTIILDEAHERSLNIDFLLGYLARLLPRRPDLKLIITSATIDPQKFSRHFGGAPVIEVSGRTFPVEIRYRPYGLDDDDDDDAVFVEGGAAPAQVDDASRGQARSRPPEIDQVSAILAAVDELLPAGDGDILVFLSGEREITDTADALRAQLTSRGAMAAAIEVLPLYGRLSMADQHRVFAPSGRRRIVLATNVAETSLTVPGIRYVIDPGTARISRYSARTKVQRLPIEKISQASAGQRAGRCGRLADGICIRLYSEADFETRAQFTEPEISRTSLASVLLQMAALGLGDVRTFPFLDPPDAQQITDGLTVLAELGALERGRTRADDGGPGAAVRLTAVGRAMAAVPVDPRLARMLVEADRRHCLADVLVMVSALAIRDVREYPLEHRDAAVAAHSRFIDPTSDFVSFLNLWHYLRRQAKRLSGNGFRKMCRAEFLHYLRIREWQDLHAQLSAATGALGMAIDESTVRWGADAGGPAGRAADGAAGSIAGSAAKPAGATAGVPTGVPAGGPVRGSEAIAVDHRAVHTALAAGLLSHIGSRLERDKADGRRGGQQRGRPAREYQGTRGSTIALWPGSVLARGGAPFVLAAELVETTRLWARTVAAVDPMWIEEVGGDLLRRNYSEPHWSGKRRAAMATEKVMLLGVTLVAARPISYEQIDPVLSRELLIRHGLVEGQLITPLPFLDANRAALDQVAESERRTRRRDIVIDDETLYALYDQRIPAEVTSGIRLESWWRKASADEKARLTFTPEMLVAAGSELARPEQYPDRLSAGGVDVDLDYVFEPGAADDGVSATVPLAALASIDSASFPAQVPGLRRDLALALIRSLPKHLRRALVPAPDFADAALARIGDAAGALPDRLAEQLTVLAGAPVRATDFDYAKVPDHLRMRFVVVDDQGRTVATGADLPAIQRSLRPATRTAVAKVSSTLERTGLTAFPAEGLPATTRGVAAGQQVTGYPALVDEGAAVGVRVYTDPADQARAMRRGMRRLLTLALGPEITALTSRIRQLAVPRGPAAPGAKTALTPADMLRLATAPHGSLPALVSDAAEAAIDGLLDWAGGSATTAEEFDRIRVRIAAHLERTVTDIVIALVPVLAAGAAAEAAITAVERGGTASAAVAQMRAEYAGWLRPGFLTAVGAAHLPDIARYLTALATRAGRLTERPDRDAAWAAEITGLTADLDAKLTSLRAERGDDEDIRAIRRMLAEYRIALFAQPMRAAIPVSAKRITAAIAALAD